MGKTVSRMGMPTPGLRGGPERGAGGHTRSCSACTRPGKGTVCADSPGSRSRMGSSWDLQSINSKSLRVKRWGRDPRELTRCVIWLAMPGSPQTAQT